MLVLRLKEQKVERFGHRDEQDDDVDRSRLSLIMVQLLALKSQRYHRPHMAVIFGRRYWCFVVNPSIRARLGVIHQDISVDGTFLSLLCY